MFFIVYNPNYVISISINILNVIIVTLAFRTFAVQWQTIFQLNFFASLEFWVSPHIFASFVSKDKSFHCCLIQSEGNAIITNCKKHKTI